MSRLTEREIEQISRARRVVRDEAANAEPLTRQAKAMQHRVVMDLIKRGFRGIVPMGTLRLLGDLTVAPIARAYRRGRTLQELRRLDDHMLADIGLERHQLRDYAWTLVAERHPETRPSPWARLAGWLEQRATIRHLESMDDRQLADIGISRWEIEAAVKGRGPQRPRAGSRIGEALREAEKGLPEVPAWSLGQGTAKRIGALDSAPISETGYVTAPPASRERADAA